MRRSVRAILGVVGACALMFAGGCWRGEPPTPGQESVALRAQPVGYAALHDAAARGPARNVLLAREAGLADLRLGATMAQVRTRYSPPTRERKTAEGVWWDYDEAGMAGTLRLLFTGEPAKLVQIQAWAPGRHQTSTMVGLLDPAVRVERKYGPATNRLPWGHDGAEAWLYPAADVAFVVTAPREKAARLVAATIVGL